VTDCDEDDSAIRSRGSPRDDPSAIDDGDAVAQLLRFIDVVRGQQTVWPSRSSAQSPHEDRRDCGSIGRRLVEENELGMVDERERDLSRCFWPADSESNGASAFSESPNRWTRSDAGAASR
jgi:hypothetical protein